MNISPAAPNRKRLVALVAVGCVATGSAIVLGVGLTSWPQAKRTAAERTAPTRALSAAEAGRLAVMRVTNYRDGRAALRATMGADEAATQLAGWVDWSRALVYLAVSGAGTDDPRGLLQAVPGVLASRPDPMAARTSGAGASPTPAATATAGTDHPPAAAVAMPPDVPPPDGWRVRPLAATGTRPAALDSFVNLLFAMAADRPDAADALVHSEARWLGRRNVGGTVVDVLLGPAVPAPAPATARPPASTRPPATARPPASTRPPATARPAGTSPAATGATARYWLDRNARLYRLETVLAGGVPVRIEFDRDTRPELAAIDALGGRPVRPRKVTNAEADLLSSMRASNRARGGAKLRLAVPTAPSASLPPANLRGAGLVDWRNSTAYLGIHELDRPADVVLLRAVPDGVAVRPAPRGPASRGGTTAAPPLPPPDERGWTYQTWPERGDALGGLDIDLLVNEALSAGTGPPYDRAALRTSAGWLREDSIAGRKVTVFDIAQPAEAGTARGHARLRYWVDAAGLLRRLELRTRTGAFAQLDLEPGPVPYVPPVPIA